MNAKSKKLPKMNKIAHNILVRDNRKIVFTEKPKDCTFSIFSHEIFKIGLELNFATNLQFRFLI